MTDPVDTNALRDMKNTENLWPENVVLVDAAAAEVDRLRRSEEDASSVRGRYESGVSVGMALVQATTEVDRLRAAIENAPHANGCTGLTISFDDYGEARRRFTGTCTCWKADAL